VLGSGDLGHRVVVRYRTDRGPTDVLGELTSIDDHGLVVRSETGDERRISRTAVLAGKRIGPRPAKFSEILALERVTAAAWPAPETERLGDWLLRAADGWTNRANSALPLGDAGCDLDEAVRACVAFYTARGLTPKITVPLPVRRDVARHLAAAGWIAQPEVLVQTAALDRVITLARAAGQPAGGDIGGAARFAVVRDADGALLACARGAVVEDPARRTGSIAAQPRPAPAQRWLHIALVEVMPHARRRGFGRAVSAALAEWAQGAGATRAVLQVEGHNEPARRLYESLGWRTHHSFVTYHRPPVPAA